MAKGIQALLFRALNGPMRGLLRSPVHGIASANLCVLMYAGRRSGRRFETPLSYVRDGGRILLLTSRDTRWWTNFVPAANDPNWLPIPVEVLAAGKILRGRARTIHQDREHLRAGVRHFLTKLPRDAMVYRIGLDAERRPKETEIGRELERLVMVEVTLED